MEIIDKVIAVLSELSGAETICLEHELQGDLGLDSLQLVLLLMTLEDCFQIVLDESDMNPFDLVDVEHVINLVEKYVGVDKDERKEES